MNKENARKKSFMNKELQKQRANEFDDKLARERHELLID